MIDKRVIACVLENHVVWVVDLAQPLLLLLLVVVVDPAQTVVTAAYRAMASPICPDRICPSKTEVTSN